MTQYVYEKYENFKSKLIHTFRIIDEKREAKIKIR
jgi:hypothetical protein